MVRIQRERGARVHAELGAVEHRSPGDQPAQRGIGDPRPAAAPHPQRIAGQLAHQALAVGVPAADERNVGVVARGLLGGERHRMVEAGHAVHGQVVQVAQPDRVQRAQRVALLGEEDVVGLQALERDHPQRVVGEEVDEERVAALLHAPDQLRRDRPALDHQHHVGPPVAARALEAPEDEALVGGLGRRVLVEGVVAPVREEADLVAEPAQLVAEVHAHQSRPRERQDDQPPHAAQPSTGAPGMARAAERGVSCAP